MINDIHLQHFRSYKDASFEFGDGVNIIVGPNGSGKTNLMESLLVLSRGKSYRVKDVDLIERGEDWARLEGAVLGGDRILKLIREPSSKIFEINDKKISRLTYKQVLPVVLFEPNHLMLLHGPPDGRRTYLDDILETIQPSFGSHRRNYKRLLQQRNTLLKRRYKPSTAELFPWNLRLSELGAAISRARTEYVQAISSDFGVLYNILASSEDGASMRYGAMFGIDTYETSMMQALEKNLTKDLDRGFTGVGPHREDFLVEIHGAPALEVASRGETRTMVLALKILELQSIEEATGKLPLLLLDDVFSELDGARRRSLTKYLKRYQTFLTTTDADVVVKHFTDCTILPLGS
ncbi:MAG: replication and repair protein RecF [Patescibacteria group bacterium]|nr:replication and repair protein RecF [Patescibacteria group bacterium]